MITMDDNPKRSDDAPRVTYDDAPVTGANIKVVGVGGGGGTQSTA